MDACRRRAHGAASRCERDDPVLRAVERRPYQLRHARVDHHQPLRAVIRSGLARDDRKAQGPRPLEPGGLPGRPDPLPDVEDARHDPAGARHEHPARLDRQAIGPPVGGDGGEERGHLAGEPARIGHRDAQRRDGEPAADVERVERREPAAQERQERERPPDRVPPCVRRAQLRPDVEVQAAEPERPVRSAAGLDRGGNLVRRHPELRRRGARGQAVMRLRLDLGVQPQEHVDAERILRRAHGSRRGCPGGQDRAGERGGLVRRLQGNPVQRRAVRDGSGRSRQVRVGLADSLERDIAIWDPGPCREGPLPAGDDVRAEAQPGQARHQGRKVVRLGGVAALPGRREGRAHEAGCSLQGRDVGDVGRRAESSRDRPQGRRQGTQPVTGLGGRAGFHPVSPG